MPFAGYPNWNAGQSYNKLDIVYYNSYLYVAMTDCSAGDNPVTATYTEYFDDGDFGFDKTYPTSEDPEPINTYSRTMRKWTVYDLPFGYYYSRFCGSPANRFQNADFANVGKEVMVLNVYRLGGPADGFELPPGMEYNWRGYGIPFGLNSHWHEPDYVYDRGGDNEQSIPSELVYHISFVPLEPSGPDSIMPAQEGDETVSGLAYQSHLYQYNTSTYSAGDYYGALFYPFTPGTVRMSTMYYAAFSRTHTYTGIPSGSASVTSPGFADNYQDGGWGPPETDPPTEWYMVGISPDHPD